MLSLRNNEGTLRNTSVRGDFSDPVRDRLRPLFGRKGLYPLTENRVISSMMTGAVSIACSDGTAAGGPACAAKPCPVRTIHKRKMPNKICLISFSSLSPELFLISYVHLPSDSPETGLHG